MSARAASQRAAILALLQERGAVTNLDLNGIAFRYAARIHELRNDGHRIASERGAGGVWTFRYLGSPA